MDVSAIQRMIQTMTSMHQNPNRPGDELYKDYHLDPLVQSERMFYSMDENHTESKERAFTIANKASTAIKEHKYEESEKMGLHALSCDPSCIDAWRVLASALHRHGDSDTAICALREIIYYALPRFNYLLDGKNDGKFYSASETRPYMRVLTDIGGIAAESGKLEISIRVYEEMIRINHGDNTGARNPLLACYLKIIGRRMRHPGAKPVRTIQHAMSLINCRFPGNDYPLMGKDDVMVRWANIMIAYHQKKNWQALAKAEYKLSDCAFKVLFREIDINEIPPANPDCPYGYLHGSHTDDMRVHGAWLIGAVDEWPEFLIDLYKLMRGKNPKFAADVRKNAEDEYHEITPKVRGRMMTLATMFLENGRKQLSNREYSKSIESFSMAKQCYADASAPDRWYSNAPFAIVSNRATAAIMLKRWNLARIDCRYTLMIKPDHDRTYKQLPKITAAFGAKTLTNELQKLLQEIGENQEHTSEEWNAFAKKAVSLLSISAVSLDAEGKLTEAKKNELLNLGIEDMYNPINISSDTYSLLPWITENDLEASISFDID